MRFRAPERENRDDPVELEYCPSCHSAFATKRCWCENEEQETDRPNIEAA